MLHSKRVLLLGVGGVGSFCLDCLVRSGVTDVTIIDFDTYDESNQNRQMWSELHEGQAKVHALKTHYPSITVHHERIDAMWVAAFDFTPYDIVLDAIDDIKAKIALMHACSDKLISSMGSAKRLDPTQIYATSIWKTQGDKFASKIRYELRHSNFKGDFDVITTKEEAQCTLKGSFVGVTGSFGLAMCSKAIHRLLSHP